MGCKIRGVIKKFLFSLFIVTALAISAKSSPATEDIAADERIELPAEAVSKKVLENGLCVLARRSPPQDLVSINIKIRAGSSTEAEYLGCGISHLVEHMLFKGTRTRSVGDIEKELKSYGGSINGSASPDLTEVNVTVLSKYLPQTLAILKDLLSNASFDAGEFEKEKEVILNEIKLHNDEPNDRLYRILIEAAYVRHPYRYPVIGYEKAFRRIARDDALKYYNRMYVPNRIVITLAGGIETGPAIEAVESQFRDFRKSDYNDLWDMRVHERPQISRRERDDEIETNLAYVAMAYHSTSILSPDLYAMDVLAMILGRGDNSRLNVSIVKKKAFAHSISCWNYTPQDPGLFVITAVMDAQNIKKAEDLVLAEIDNLRNTGISQDELAAAKRMVLADYLLSRQTIEVIAADTALGYMMTADSEFSRKYVDGIGAVAADEIRRAANKYLRADGLTIARVLPRSSPASKKSQEAALPAKDLITKESLPNGLRLLLREDKKSPTVAISAAMMGGLMAEDSSDNGISSLAATMLLKGTADRKEDRVAGAIEEKGGQISPFSGFNSFGVNVEILKPDLGTALEIIKDILTGSVFPQDEIDKAKTIAIAMIGEEETDLFRRASDTARNSLFGDSPYGMKYLGTEKSVTAIKRDDLVGFYRRYCVPDNIVMSISGDIDTREVAARVKELFSNFKGPGATVPEIAIPKAGKIASVSFEMDKEESLVLLGFRTAGLKSADRYALDALGAVLSGFGRMHIELRDKRSLSYTQGTAHKMALGAGYFFFYAATSKDKVPEVRAVIRSVIDDIKTEGITDEDLALAKRRLDSAYLSNSQLNSFYSSTSALDELYGLGYADLYSYLKEVGKLTREDLKRVAVKYLNMDSCAEITILSK
jgi:zinc protease